MMGLRTVLALSNMKTCSTMRPVRKDEPLKKRAAAEAVALAALNGAGSACTGVLKHEFDPSSVRNVM